MVFHDNITGSWTPHQFSSLAKSHAGANTSGDFPADPLDSLQRALKSVIISINSTKQTTKALAGAVFGLQGSASNDALVTDSSTAVKNLQRAHYHLIKAQKIVSDVANPAADIKTETDDDIGTSEKGSSDVSESSMPVMQFCVIESILISKHDYRKFIYSTLAW